ncbi:MAG: hypothetical protein ACKOAL_10485 [Chthoniobacterales bacterium]
MRRTTSSALPAPPAICALEISERRRLALREFFRDFGQDFHAIVGALQGQQRGGLGVERARGELPRTEFLHEGIDQR